MIDFTKQYIYIGIFRIDTYPFKDWVVNTFKPKYKWNMYAYLHWDRKKIYNDELNCTGTPQSYNDFSHIGRYNNVFYFTEPISFRN